MMVLGICIIIAAILLTDGLTRISNVLRGLIITVNVTKRSNNDNAMGVEMGNGEKFNIKLK